MSESIATGAKLTPETFADFVTRLKHHCRGEGVSDHCTAAAIFTVQARRLIYGISEDYTDNVAIICDDSVWNSVAEYVEHISDFDEDQMRVLDATTQSYCQTKFIKCSEQTKLELIKLLDDHTVTGWEARWEHVGTHFTKEAAEAFIARKGHDYPDGIRVYVEAQPYAWEFETIKDAIMDGRLIFAEGSAS